MLQIGGFSPPSYPRVLGPAMIIIPRPRVALGKQSLDVNGTFHMRMDLARVDPVALIP